MASPNSWASGYPPLTRPYYDEYMDLLNPCGVGVRRYHESFAIDRFLCPPETRLAGLRSYLGTLIGLAQAKNAIPVLKFCRSMGRFGWMRRHFPSAVHIAVMRNPASQWASARRQYLRHDNLYFMAASLRTLAANRGSEAVDAVTDALRVRLPLLAGCNIAEDLALCVAHMAQLSPEDGYRAFLASWLLAALSASDPADMVIDTDLLTSLAPLSRLNASDHRCLDWHRCLPRQGLPSRYRTRGPRSQHLPGAGASLRAALQRDPFSSTNPGRCAPAGRSRHEGS